MIRCPNCDNEAPRENFKTEFEVLGAFMNQPVVKCNKCASVLMETGRFRKKWTRLEGDAAEMMERNLTTARGQFQAELQSD